MGCNKGCETDQDHTKLWCGEFCFKASWKQNTHIRQLRASVQSTDFILKMHHSGQATSCCKVLLTPLWTMFSVKNLTCTDEKIVFLIKYSFTLKEFFLPKTLPFLQSFKYNQLGRWSTCIFEPSPLICRKLCESLSKDRLSRSYEGLVLLGFYPSRAAETQGDAEDSAVFKYEEILHLKLGGRFALEKKGEKMSCFLPRKQKINPL